MTRRPSARMLVEGLRPADDRAGATLSYADDIIWNASPQLAEALVKAAIRARRSNDVVTGSAMAGKHKIACAVKDVVTAPASDPYGGLARAKVALRINIEACKRLDLPHSDDELDRVLYEQEPAIHALVHPWRGLPVPYEGDMRIVIDDTQNGKSGFHINTRGRWRTSLHTINVPFESMYGDDLNGLLRRGTSR